MSAERDTWFILHAPGCVPERKRCPVGQTKRFLLELMAARPRELITVLNWSSDGPNVEDGTVVLEILDGRYRGRARRHRQSTAAAFAEPRHGR